MQSLLFRTGTRGLRTITGTGCPGTSEAQIPVRHFGEPSCDTKIPKMTLCLKRVEYGRESSRENPTTTRQTKRSSFIQSPHPHFSIQSLRRIRFTPAGTSNTIIERQRHYTRELNVSLSRDSLSLSL